MLTKCEIARKGKNSKKSQAAAKKCSLSPLKDEEFVCFIGGRKKYTSK